MTKLHLLNQTMTLSATSRLSLSTFRTVTPPPLEKPIPISHHLSCEEIPPTVQPEPPLAHLKTISPPPVTYHLGEESNLAAASFQVVIDKIIPEPLFLQD